MSAARRKQSRGRRKKNPKQKAVDLWEPVPELPAPEQVDPASDPSGLVRSLGPPPLPGQTAVAEHYMVAVVDRAAAMATALAAAAGLLADPDGEHDDGEADTGTPDASS